MQLWLRNVQKKVKHMQSCCFADINLLLFFHDPTSNADLFIVPTHLPTYLPTCLSVCLSKMHAVCNFKHCTLRLYGYVKSRYYAAMENVITFMRYWYLIKRTTNSAGIRANWINCVLYKVLLNLHFFPVLNIYCTEPYLGPVQRSYVYLYWQSHGPLIPIKIIVQFFECKIPERVLLKGGKSICSRFQRFHTGLSIYIMTYNTRYVFQTKK